MLGARAGAAAAVISLLVACSSSPQGKASGNATVGEWPAFRADLARDGHSAGSLTASDAEHLAPAWRVKLTGAVDGSAVVAGGEVIVGSEAGDLVAIDETTGAIRWKRSGLGPISGSPAVEGGTVYVATLSGRLIALARSTGATEWTWDAPGTEPAIWSSPSPYRGSILVGIGSQSGDEPLESGRIVAVSSAGRESWQLCVRQGCAPGGGVWSSPAFDSSGHGFVGLGNPEDGVLAFDSSSGAVLWRTSFYSDDGRDLDVGATPVVYEISGREVVGVGSVGGVFKALDAVTGQTVWSDNLVAGTAVLGLIASPAYDGSSLYVASAGAAAGLFALDAATGAVRWMYPTSLAIYSAPAVADGVVVFGEGNVFGDTTSGSVVALDTGTSKPLWTFDAHAAVRSGPVIAGDLIVVGDANGDVLGFRPNR